ncbi:hypothetical protein ACLNGM_16990 [Aureimonas phyllosphaerae]|uniref:hypothetical protein n=1 Tax=Aureimonas phyllosphaerae TaxID=1166078 RepID=UPI003A5C4C7D
MNLAEELETGGTKFEAPIRLVSSHHVSNPGFLSHRKGEFWFGRQHIAQNPFHEADVHVLGVDLKSISITYVHQDVFLLTVEFAVSRSFDQVEEFLGKVAEAFSSALARSQQDAWYGNLVLKLDVEGLRDVSPKLAGTLHIEASVQLSSIDTVPVDRRIFENLRWTPLTSIFVEGMRSPQAKSKFLFWFVILEELEKRVEFLRLFTPLLSKEEKSQISAMSLSKEAKSRIENVLNAPTTTREGRPEKLLRILQHIGLGEISNSDGKFTVDEAVCRSLIKQRNNVAHLGAVIDEHQLYRVLFPLAQGALRYLEKEGP